MFERFKGQSFYQFPPGKVITREVKGFIREFTLNSIGENKGVYVALGPSYSVMKDIVEGVFDEHLGFREPYR